MRKVAIILTALVSALQCFSQQRIPLSAQDAYANQHKKDDFTKLSDGDITTHYTVWSPQITPYRVTYDWSGYDNAVVKELKLYVNNGNPSQLKFYIHTADGREVLLKAYPGGGWTPAYQTFTLTNTEVAKEFIIQSSGGSDFPDEIEVYGTYAVHSWPASTRTPSPIADLFGVVIKPWDICNGLFPEKIPSLQSLNPSRVRLYNDYQLNHTTAGTWNMNQSTGWAQVDNMKRLKNVGIATQMCYQSFPYEPFPTGEVRNDPATYLQLAKDIYDFGIDNKANGEYFKTIEVGNEMNRWYAQNFAEYMDGYALAAMMSICYDGHHGKYPGVGLKASGSKAEVSICGLAEGEPYLLYQIAEWSKKNRGYRADGTIDLPFDIYSFHCYSSLEGQRQGIPGGVPPEYGMSSYIKRLNDIRLHNFSWLKIHIGEWGWDISPNSSLNAPAYGKYNADQTSAMWTARTIVLMAENYMNASSYYRIKTDYDALDDGNYLPFATMALIRSWGTGVKQSDGSYQGLDLRHTLTGDYFAQLSKLFSEGWVFDSRVSSTPNVLKFTKGISELYVVWSTEQMTVTDKPQFTETTTTYSFSKSGTVRRLADHNSGVMTNENYIAGTQLRVDAKPIFIVINPTNTPLPIHLISFTAQKINQAVVLKWVVQDADKVEVERSSDGNHFTSLGEGILNKYVDMHPGYGKNYYRLKMYEPDGSYSYSNILAISITGKHSKVIAYNVAGQVVKQGYSEDVESWKSSLPNGVYYFRYDNSFTETFIKRL
jgi:hypothetical protein